MKNTLKMLPKREQLFIIIYNPIEKRINVFLIIMFKRVHIN